MYLIRERFFRLGEDSDITDEHGRPVLHVDGKVVTLRNRLVLRDPEGRDTYAVDVVPEQDDPLLLASVLALDPAEDQERQQR